MARQRQHGRVPPRWAEVLGRGLVLLPIVVAPLLGGTAERPYTLVVAALCALSGLAAAALTLWRGETLKVSLFSVALLIAIAVTLLQCVPLPPGLRAALAPGTDATLRLLMQDTGGQPSPAGRLYLPLSVDPAATANEAVRLLGYLSLLVALGTLLQRRGDSLRIGRVIYGSASLVAALGALAALGVPLPAPLAVPAGGATRALLPAAFYNSNHMAALLSVGAIVTVGALLETASRGPRILLALLLALQDAALLGTLSRAGILVGVTGQLAVLLWGRREPERGIQGLGAGTLLALLPLLAAAVLVVQNAGWLAGLQARFAALDRAELLAGGSKVRAWLDVLPLLRGHLLLGVGRGAFESAFAGSHPYAEATRFVYLENQWLQALCDWGVPAGLCLGALLALALREGGRRLLARPSAGGPRSRVRVAALCAFVGLLVHNTVDFNLEVGGVAVAALALLALIEQPRYTLSPHLCAALAAVALLGSAVVYRLCPSHEEDGARLRELAMASATAVPTERVVAEGTRASRRHPLDSYLYATVAARLLYDRDPAAVTWANRALSANPRDLGARRTVALILAGSGHKAQALRTLSLAIADGNRLQRQWLLQTALQLAASPAELLAVLPEAADPLPRELSAGQLAEELLELLGQASETPPWPLIGAVAEWGRARGSREALVWLGRACLAQRDAPAATTLLGELIAAQAPPLLVGDLLMLLVDTSHLDEAERLVPQALSRGRTAEVLLAAALLQERRGHLSTARSLLDTAQTVAERPPLRARVHEVRAELETRAGNLHRAELERAAAAQLRP